VRYSLDMQGAHHVVVLGFVAAVSVPSGTIPAVTRIKAKISYPQNKTPRTPAACGDYSVDGNFDNSPLIENQIIFAEDFYKTLSTPQPRIERTEIKEFTSSGTYTFNKGFPATIEVYALGGGGQGGHTSDWIKVVLLTTDHGTGGSGGGGGAGCPPY